MCVIREGLTTQLQPLDVCLQKPFKDRVHQMWSDRICSIAVTKIESGLHQRHNIPLVCHWVKYAWDSMPPEMIQEMFSKMWLSNALDGTEDDTIYEDQEQEEDQQQDNNKPYTVEPTPKEIHKLFASHDSEFEGFQESTLFITLCDFM